jgi:hypothetical protein
VQIDRLVRVRVIAVAIVALLFAQWSVAAYACPLLATQGANTMAGMDCEGMASEMDPASPNLCAEHCKYGEQGDQLRPPTVPAVSLTSLYVVPLNSTITESSELVIVSSGLLAARPPPHTILHCCLRI